MMIISWDTISKHKYYEGLGLRDLVTIKESIYAKWILSILNKFDSL